jgi:hypothetical protein
VAGGGRESHVCLPADGLAAFGHVAALGRVSEAKGVWRILAMEGHSLLVMESVSDVCCCTQLLAARHGSLTVPCSVCSRRMGGKLQIGLWVNAKDA